MTRLTRILGGLAIGLVVLSAVLRLALAILGLEGADSPLGVVAGIFDVERDASVPTWFSSAILLLAAALVWQILATGASAQWASSRALLRILVGGLIYVSIDETARIHEQLNEPVSSWLEPAGAFRYGWVVFAIPVVIALIFFYVRWVWSLPTALRRIVIWGALLFVGGAVGFEMVGSALGDVGVSTLERGTAHIEELCEMLGVVLFIEAMIRLLGIVGWDGNLRLGSLTSG